MAQPRLRQPTSGSIFSRHRYSVASTSTTLFTYEEEHEDAYTPTSEPRFEGQHSARSVSAGNGKGKGKGAAIFNTDEDAQSYAGAVPVTLPVALAKNEVEELEELDYSDLDLDNEDADCDLALAEEDQLDRLIRMTTSILRVSKSILSSAKRIGVAESAFHQTSFGREEEMRRNLEGLETQHRFLGVMSNDAHSMLHPTITSPRPPHPLISTSSSYSNPTWPPPLLTGDAQPKLRARTSGSSISISAPRAKTMYINAEALSSPNADQGSNSRMLGTKSSSQSGGTENNIAELESEESLHDFDGLPKESGLDLGVDDDDIETVASPTSSKPDDTRRVSITSASASLTAAASLTKANSLPSSPVIGSAKDATGSPSLTTSGFFSSFFARSAPAPLPSATARSAPSSGDRQDAKALLAALSGSTSPPSSILPSKAVIPSSSPETPLSSNLQQRPSRHSSTPATPSPPSTSTSASQYASAQLSVIHSSSPHLTISKCSSQNKPRHRASLSESLLRASVNASGSPSEALERKGIVREEGEKGHKRNRQSTPPAFGSLSERFWVSNVPVNGQAANRAPG